MSFIKRKSLLFLLMTLFIVVPAHPNSTANGKASDREELVKVKFIIGKNEAIAVLNNSEAAKEFAAQLPLTLTFKDYAAVEKISYLPVKISKKATAGSQEKSSGDFAYYSPWGNIAVFYKGAEQATGDLHILGNFESGKEFFNINNSFEATLVLVK